MNFFTKSRLICRMLLAGIAGALFVSYMINPRSKRVVLYFPQNGGGISVEERYLPQELKADCAVSVVRELLLGPALHTAQRLTAPEVRPHSCFVRGSSLYVDFPSLILTPELPMPDFYTLYTLLQKNIEINCKNIDSIYVYIDGVPVYRQMGSTALDITQK